MTLVCSCSLAGTAACNGCSRMNEYRGVSKDMNFFWNWDLDNKFDHYVNPKTNFNDTPKKVTIKEYDINGNLIKETITEE